MRLSKVLIGMGLAVAAGVASASAGTAISVVNPGFESLQASITDTTPVTLATGEYTSGVAIASVLHSSTSETPVFVPGWVPGSNGGGYVENFGPISSTGLTGQGGSNVLVMVSSNFGNSVVTNVNNVQEQLGSTFQEGSYVLSVDLSAAPAAEEKSAAGQVVVQLGTGSVDTTSLLSTNLTKPGFTNLSQTIDIPAGDSRIGKQMSIILGVVDTTTLTETLFDDVSLTFTPAGATPAPTNPPSAVPLPAAGWMGLATLGVLTAGIRGFRRRIGV